MADLRLFFTTDLHGSEGCFFKFLNASKVYKASVIIVGGDITGKMIIPIIQGDGVFRASYQGGEQILKSPKDVEVFEKTVRDTGYYPYHTNAEEIAKLSEDKERLTRLFKDLMLERVKKWVGVADERLKGQNVQCYVMPGNDDDFYVDEAFKGTHSVVNPEGKVVDLMGGYEMISSGFCNRTPWNCPRDVEEEKMKEILANMTSRVKDFKRCIFNLHCPPNGTALDECPKLDKDLKPVLGLGGTPQTIHVGSTSVKEIIDQYQPMLSLHGHIHESRSAVKIGRTLCINPGSEYGECILRGVIANISGDSMKGYLLTSG